MRAKHVSMIEREVDGVPVIMTEFGYKTMSMVVKSLGSFIKKTSPTYLRTSGVMEGKFGQPRVCVDYPKPSVDYIVDLYEKNEVKHYDTLVIGPTLELCCYIGRALNAPVLPSQFIASARDRWDVEKNVSSDNHYIVGHEMDWPELCLWIKPRNLGELYSKMIDRAKNVVIVSRNSGPQNHLGTCRGWSKDNISVLEGFTADDNFRGRIGDPSLDGYADSHDKMPHWEFAMEIEQTVNLERYCASKGKNTIMISTGDWSGFIPALLFKRLYEKNDLLATGISFHCYWACHPFYESEFLRIPATAFQYGADVYVSEFKKLIDSIEFSSKDSECLVWDQQYNDMKSMDPASRFEEWGFPNVYMADRPYDCWHFFYHDYEDILNPTRQWIVPKLAGRRNFREFNKYLDIEELVDIARSVRKVEVNCRKNETR